jgi:hypothetical protein
MARPRAPESSTTSASTVGLPRESRTSRPITCSMALTTSLPRRPPGGTPGHKTSGCAPSGMGTPFSRRRPMSRAAQGAGAQRLFGVDAQRRARLATRRALADEPRFRSPPSLDADRRPRAGPTSAAARQRRRRRADPPAPARSGPDPDGARLALQLGGQHQRGRSAGMPSVTLVRPFSSFLISSQLATTCWAVLGFDVAEDVRVPVDELVVHAAGHIGQGELPASSARRAWKTIWNSRSPSSSSQMALQRRRVCRRDPPRPRRGRPARRGPRTTPRRGAA